jgi:uncharacterized membrane protein YeaQ/YmgE (transglycosylase-associated protein family)
MGFHGQGILIISIIWCAIGAVIGWIVGTVAGKNTYASRIEDVLVGVFGAFIGGEFLADMVRDAAVVDPGFTITALALAVAGALGMLGLLAVMRRAVGPMRAGESRSVDRR